MELLINKNFYKFLIVFLLSIKYFCISELIMVYSRNRANSVFFRNTICIVFSIVFAFLISIKQSYALPHEWVGVPKSEY